ncbi:MAG: ferredoxin [Patescibacteria group bacterium]|jgi:ferredoxin
MAELEVNGKSHKIKDGGAIKAACKEGDIPFACENGVCGTCEINITSGMENLSPLSQEEKDMQMDNNVRLACQCKIMKGKVCCKQH